MIKIKFTCLALLLHLFASTAFAQHDYFKDINGVKGGETIKNALHNIIKNHICISYGSGINSTWGAFYTTDAVIEDNKRRVLDMYSDSIRYFGEQGASIKNVMNIEHCLPKSWWGSTENDAYCDLHNLNPSDESANIRKSNRPLGELTTITWNNGVAYIGQANIDGSSENAYEPCDEYKGDFARTYMYMFTCYQDFTWTKTYMNYENSSYPTLKPWAAEMLIKWHKQDPVSEKEINRNNAIYSIQGNRNPFIDYPQLADYIWGDSIDYTFRLPNDSTVGEGGFGVTRIIDIAEGWKVYIKENFSGSMTFTTKEITGNFPWQINENQAVASSFSDSTNHNAESWILSPYIDFSKDIAAKISFDYSIRYSANASTQQKLYISDNYTGSISEATWEQISFNAKNWDTKYVSELALPQKYMGKKDVTIAFYYKGTTKEAGTFKIDNILLQATENGDNGTSDEEDGEKNEDTDTPNINKDEHFTLVTSATEISECDTIIIAYESTAMASQNDNYRNKIDGLEISRGSILSIPEGTQKIVLEKGNKENTFAFNVGDGYLASSSNDSNHLITIKELTDAASWMITISQDGLATITAQGEFERNILQYYNNKSYARFSCYTGKQKMVNIYVKHPVVTGIADIKPENNLFDVYSINGIHIRTATDRDSALKGLKKGIYIMEGEKVIIR